MEVYLDNSATTRAFGSVCDIVTKTMNEDYGNPSSMHRKGIEAERYVKWSREVIAKSLRVHEKEILFTSGGTESNNMAIIGGARGNHRRGKHIITTVIEHPSVIQPMRYLEEQGFEVTYLPVSHEGLVSVTDLEQAMRSDTILVSIMYVNNEIGSVQRIEELAKCIHQKNPETLFHVDAVQAFGKYVIRPKQQGIDMLSVSAHKIHGPKGVGFLYVRDRVKLQPILFGGGQQRAMRSGTENVPGIAGLGEAVREIYHNHEYRSRYLYSLRELFIHEVSRIEGTIINGQPFPQGAPHIVSISFVGVRSEVLLHALEDRGIYVSAGSACSSNHPTISETLKGIGVPKQLLDATLRFSFSIDTTREEIMYTVDVLKELLPMLRRFRRS